MTLTDDQKMLVAYALRALASNVDEEVLSDLGRGEIDAGECDPENEPEVDAIMEQRLTNLENELAALATAIFPEVQ